MQLVVVHNVLRHIPLTNLGQDLILLFLLHVVCNRVQRQQHSMENMDIVDV